MTNRIIKWIVFLVDGNNVDFTMIHRSTQKQNILDWHIMENFTPVYGRMLQIIYIIMSIPVHVYLVTAYTSLNLMEWPVWSTIEVHLVVMKSVLTMALKNSTDIRSQRRTNPSSFVKWTLQKCIENKLYFLTISINSRLYSTIQRQHKIGIAFFNLYKYHKIKC